MTTQLVITVPDEIHQRIQRLADKTGYDVSYVLSMMLGLSLPEMDEQPVETLSDDEVMTLADSMMDSAQSSRMSQLVNKQKESAISSAEEDELRVLMTIYEAGQLRKLEAIAEAVKRGLWDRLDA